jgi:hypothetical protein
MQFTEVDDAQWHQMLEESCSATFG